MKIVDSYGKNGSYFKVAAVFIGLCRKYRVKYRPLNKCDLRNNYGEISEFCHKHDEPVFLTKNGTGDLCVLNIEAYEQLVGKFKLYAKLEKRMADIKAGRTIPAHNGTI